MAEFKPKTKEPQISETLQGVLLRSIGIDKSPSEYDKFDTYEVYRIKHKILTMLLENQDLLHALHSEELGYEGELNGDEFKDIHIFDYLRLPKNKDKVKNYVCFECNELSGGGSYIERRVVFWVVSHDDDHVTDWGIGRQDLLSLIICELFNWTNRLGMTLVKQSDNGLTTNDGYCYRELVFVNNPPNDVQKKMRTR